MSSEHGKWGEDAAERLLRYDGYEILERQYHVGGHRVDFLVRSRGRVEWLVEVKVWMDPKKVGTDTVKKALHSARDLKLQGETRPYMLILSHDLTGTYRDQITRSVAAGDVDVVFVLTLLPWQHS